MKSIHVRACARQHEQAARAEAERLRLERTNPLNRQLHKAATVPFVHSADDADELPPEHPEVTIRAAMDISTAAFLANPLDGFRLWDDNSK